MIFGATRHSYTLEVSSKESSVEDSSTLFWNHHTICIEEIVVTLSLSTDLAFIGVCSHGYLYTGQLCRHFVFRQVDIMGAVCWDPNYTLGLDFLDHNFLSSKNSG